MLRVIVQRRRVVAIEFFQPFGRFFGIALAVFVEGVLIGGGVGAVPQGAFGRFGRPRADFGVEGRAASGQREVGVVGQQRFGTRDAFQSGNFADDFFGGVGFHMAVEFHQIVVNEAEFDDAADDEEGGGGRQHGFDAVARPNAGFRRRDAHHDGKGG